MYSGEIIKTIYLKEGSFFDFVLEDDFPLIIDYQYFDREIIVSYDDAVKVGGVKVKRKIATIAELRLKLKELISDAKEYYYEFICDKAVHDETPGLKQMLNAYFNIKDEDMELLVNQLVFDVLYDKYLETSYEDVVKLSTYCAKHFYYELWDKGWTDNIKYAADSHDIDGLKDTARHMMKRQLIREHTQINKEAYAEFGIDIVKGIDSLFQSEYKPKVVWDFFFHRGSKNLVTSRQCRRNFSIKRKADYLKLANELNDYDRYIENARMRNHCGNSAKEYFQKSMGFYTLEMSSRMDFMYKLAETFESEGFSNAHKIRFLIEGYDTTVACPYIEQDADGNLAQGFRQETRCYFPLPLIEKSCGRKMNDLLHETDKNPFLDEGLIYVYRAKVHALFKYHYVFNSEDYDDISDFISNNFDIRSYYDSGKIWKGLSVFDDELTHEQKIRLLNIQLINNHLIPHLENGNILRWKNSSDGEGGAGENFNRIDEAKIRIFNSEEYSVFLGMDKDTFTSVINILESAFKELHTQGGRPTKLSVVDRLVITIEHNRNNRSMGNLANDYGVSKSQIHNAVKWVKETIAEDGGFSLTELFNG